MQRHFIRLHTALENIESYQCEHCTYKNKTKTYLRQHVKAKHISSGLFSCDRCEYKSVMKINIKNKHKHIVHTIFLQRIYYNNLQFVIITFPHLLKNHIIEKYIAPEKIS